MTSAMSMSFHQMTLSQNSLNCANFLVMKADQLI